MAGVKTAEINMIVMDATNMADTDAINMVAINTVEINTTATVKTTDMTNTTDTVAAGKISTGIVWLERSNKCSDVQCANLTIA